MNEGSVIVSTHWRVRHAELSFVTRSIAEAASRYGPVSVLVPGPFGQREPDGAFDLDTMGPVGELRWPRVVPSDRTVVVDELTPELAALLVDVDPEQVLYLTSSVDNPDPAWRRLHPVSDSLNVYVPVNRQAERHRHHGFGFTGYVLVLSDRSGSQETPPSAVAWLSSAFHDAYVVVIENAVASTWKGRVLRGAVSVDTRMDLWRLVAHANVCVDLGPGSSIARECIEALRFGTPIIVPENSGPAEVHAQAGGGSIFGDPGELLAAAGKMRSRSDRSEASAAARRYADDRYGNPPALVTRMRELLQGT